MPAQSRAFEVVFSHTYFLSYPVLFPFLYFRGLLHEQNTVLYISFKMSDLKGMNEYNDPKYEHDNLHNGAYTTDGTASAVEVKALQRGLSGFHTSMIAIGGAIGAGLFVSAGGAFSQGGPASVLIGFAIIGVMML